VLPTNYNNLEKIRRVPAPKLIVHGDRDEIVPFAMGQKLFEAAADPKYFYPVKDAGHNDVFIVGGEKYFEAFADFAGKAKTTKEPVLQPKSDFRSAFDTSGRTETAQ
jgi:fermentation-respiration switch protein FrsA (DUF1100 family)